jgi:phosphate transport system substrate-binding protein
MNGHPTRLRICALTAVFASFSLSGQTLAGAGATFPYPLYQKWFAAFAEKSTNLSFTYRQVGSGAGIELLRSKEIDFAATDAPLSDDELHSMPSKVLHLPTVIGGVVPIYHIDGVLQDLRFTPQILAGIYEGKIKRWDDPQIKSANHGLRLPAREIKVVHRSDGSGTTYVWTSYLASVSEDWRNSIGAGKIVKWPVGEGAAQNNGVAEAVRSMPDSIGYVEFIYALEAHLSYGAVRNASGRFVQANLNSLTAASASANSTPEDFRLSIINAPGREAYPIAAYTFFLVPEKFQSEEKAKAMTGFLRWALTSGQKQSAGLGYAALPDSVAKRALDALGAIE